jgi:HCOMODA/2-hydroxy-3-carboxy-muconic semialdehyde decarboxylase
MASLDDMTVELTSVGRVLAAFDLVTAFGHVSRRTSDTSFEITALGDLATLVPAQVVAVDIDDDTLPPGAPGESWLHAEIYRSRPDACGIVRAQPVSTFAVAAVTDVMRPVYGQAAWLGGAVPVLATPRLVRSRELGSAAARALGDADGLLLRANGAVTVGPDPGIAAARMWLLSTACDVWLRAHAAGTVRELDEADIAAWTDAAPPLLQRLWRAMEFRVGRQELRL